MSDIGAIDPGSWQSWHLAWKIGAMSLVKVTLFVAADWADNEVWTKAIGTARARTPVPQRNFPTAISGSFFNKRRIVSLAADPESRDLTWEQMQGLCRAETGQKVVACARLAELFLAAANYSPRVSREALM